MRQLLLIVISFIALSVHAHQVNEPMTIADAAKLGLKVVVITTVDEEEPTVEKVYAPVGCMGTGATNATKVPGRIQIFAPTDSETPIYDSGEYKEDKSGMTIKIRGNSTANFLSTRKPYKIKLQKKADLLSRTTECKDKEWGLLTTLAEDDYAITNTLGFGVSDIVGQPWTPAMENVTVLFNGKFRGLYTLVELVKKSSDRIDVADDGYIAEIDPYWWNEPVSVKTMVYAPYTSPYQITFKYPDSDDITQAQIDVMQGVMDRLDSAIVNPIDGNDYSKHINLDSWARWLLIHQILGDGDAAGSNQYFYRHDCTADTLLNMGPVWDFDAILRYDVTQLQPTIYYHYFREMLLDSPSRALGRKMQEIYAAESEDIFSRINTFLDSLTTAKAYEGADMTLAEAVDNVTNLMTGDAGFSCYPTLTTIENARAYFQTRKTSLDVRLHDLPSEDIISGVNTIAEDAALQVKPLKRFSKQGIEIQYGTRTYNIIGQRKY